jgi:hypothetical protein
MDSGAAAVPSRNYARRVRPIRVARAVVFAAILLSAILIWRWMQASSPSRVVERAGDAIKAGDWKTVYYLVAWSDDQKQMLDVGRFVSLASIYGKVYTLESYQVGAPSVKGETAVVPVTVTAKVSGLFNASTKTDSAEVRCRRVGGEWRIAPDLHNGLLGMGKVGIGGL